MKVEAIDKGRVVVGLLSASDKILVNGLVQHFPLNYKVERISLDQLSVFSNESKFGSLKQMKALVVDGLEEELQIFRLAYLIKRTYPHVKLILVQNDIDDQFEGKSHFDAYVNAEHFKAEIESTLSALKVGKDDFFSRIRGMFKSFVSPAPIFFS